MKTIVRRLLILSFLAFLMSGWGGGTRDVEARASKSKNPYMIKVNEQQNVVTVYKKTKKE